MVVRLRVGVKSMHDQFLIVALAGVVDCSGVEDPLLGEPVLQHHAAVDREILGDYGKPGHVD